MGLKRFRGHSESGMLGGALGSCHSRYRYCFSMLRCSDCSCSAAPGACRSPALFGPPKVPDTGSPGIRSAYLGEPTNALPQPKRWRVTKAALAGRKSVELACPRSSLINSICSTV